MQTTDVVIAGAGIIGLATALELAAEGLRVLVLERGRAMSESSWAAAGMLAAHDPANPIPLEPLAELSLSLYPTFLERLQHVSGHRVPLRTRQTLQGSRPGESLPVAAARWGRPIDASTARAAVPGLNIQGRQFLLLDEDSLDPRDLCTALPRAIAASGVQLMEESAVLAVTIEGQGVVVQTAKDSVAAAAFLNCCGAWAGLLPGSTGKLPPGPLGIEPRKGQLVTVELPACRNTTSESLDPVLRTPEIYLVPRGNGRVVIGATIERASFDKTSSSRVARTLVDEACSLWPPLAAARLVETWVGLRPGSADGLPVMGRCGADPLWMACGHFRNGILLAPATARIMRQLIAGVRPDIPVEAFAANRFALHEG